MLQAEKVRKGAVVRRSTGDTRMSHPIASSVTTRACWSQCCGLRWYAGVLAEGVRCVIAALDAGIAGSTCNARGECTPSGMAHGVAEVNVRIHRLRRVHELLGAML